MPITPTPSSGWFPAGMSPQPSQETPETPDDSGSDAGDKNNSDGNINLWQDDATETDVTTSEQTQPQTPSDEDVGKQLADFYRKSSSDWPKLSAEQLSQAMQDGNPAAIQEFIEGREMHMMASMLDSMKTIAANIAEKAEDAAVSRAGNRANGQQALQLMNDTLPYTMDADLAPVAGGVLKQALKKTGGDQKKAIEMVRAYFDKTAKLTASASNPSNRGRSSQHSTQSVGGHDASEDDDFFDLLNG